MLTKLEGSTKSAVIAFEPRQVTLAKQNMAKKLSSETLANDSKDKTLTIEQKLRKSKKKKSMNSSDRAVFFHSIAAYLDLNGFSKTLYAFRSEALSEINDWKGHSLDLEEMYYKYLESRRCHAEENVNHSKELEIADLPKDGATEKVEGESNFDVSVELTKKKRKKNNEGDGNPLNVQPVMGSNFAKCVDDSDRKLADEVSNHICVKYKEKMKKHKLEVSEELADGTSHELQSDEFNKSAKDKKKKKKKSKLIPESDDEGIEQSQSETSREAINEKSKDSMTSKNKCKVDSSGLDAAEVQSKGKRKNKEISDTFLENTENVVLKDVQKVGKRKPEDFESSRRENGDSSVTKLDANETFGVVPLDAKNVKSKGKKKKKDRLASESTCFEDKKEFDQGDPKKIDFIKEDLQTKGDNGVDIQNKSSKKRKRLVSEERKSLSDGEIGIKEVLLRKDEGAEEDKGSQQHPKEVTSIEVDGNATKKRKTHIAHIESNNSREMSVDNQLGGLSSGNFENNGTELSASEKKIKKQQNGFAEPKTVNAFQRVKVEEVKFVDERLQDNSYWAKGGADSGYGAKAQEVLGQVRGRDFRHEKTKKKRGSYRGGQIDVQSHSIKFNYSDDE
ncbi:hypothetical protein NE237_025907 [Protea cynaroides]|uniref:Srp40 C-terminal domain-containing protein n=1 Tax=Protea cynaroides TaxID=273540 RepID=A0A9Q0H543_9MAGN|nr:hypothetical protein NE237_025907 [Protea cynaroides]